MNFVAESNPVLRTDDQLTAGNRISQDHRREPSKDTSGPADKAQPAMRIGIAASGRFHLLDLARELNTLGAEVLFYSYVPWARAKTFGLLRHCHVALLPFLFPLVAAERIFPRAFPNIIERLTCYALDIFVIVRLRRCDVFICMSGMYVWAPRYAKWRYGALVHLHRSSRHILSQQAILKTIPNARQVSSFMVARELAGYALADRIIVPSSHVVESFAPWPDCAAKVFLNPLGVDIEQFPLRQSAPDNDLPTVLFIGQWSYRKGVDVLVKAVQKLPKVRLIHVGTLNDAPFPNGTQFVHFEHVPQAKLPKFYSAAHVFVLPSREDGFGVVISQALASGVMVICTDRTGGPDLARLPGISRLIRIVPPDDPHALRQAIEETLDDVMQGRIAQISENERVALGWQCYAQRDLQFMEERLAVTGKSYSANGLNRCN
jgi:alpha-maltose-1-phosphate synthase